MPAFTFEKISPPEPRIEAGDPAPVTVRRNVIVRLLDRLTSARLRRVEGDVHKVERLKSKYRKYK